MFYIPLLTVDQKSSHIFCNRESIDPSSNRMHNQQNFSANVERRDHKSNKRAIQMVLFDLNRHSTFTLPKVFSVVSIPVKPNFLPKGSSLQMPHLQSI